MLKLYVAAKNRISAAARKLFKREEGASLVEYALLVALIAAVCVTVITTLGGSINDLFTTIDGKIDGANTAAGGGS